MNYRTDRFEGFYHQKNGQRFWDFLREHDTLVRMESATYLGRPAVEPLSPSLMQRFGGEVAQKRIKQMIGHMVRQIMESRGFQLERSNVRIRRPGNIFFCGSRYIRPQDMPKAAPFGAAFQTQVQKNP